MIRDSPCVCVVYFVCDHVVGAFLRIRPYQFLCVWGTRSPSPPVCVCRVVSATSRLSVVQPDNTKHSIEVRGDGVPCTCENNPVSCSSGKCITFCKGDCVMSVCNQSHLIRNVLFLDRKRFASSHQPLL